MPRLFIATLVATAAMLAVSIVYAQTQKPQAAAPQAAMSDEELAKVGEPLVTNVCTKACHGIEQLEEFRRPRAGWTTVVADMMTKGAEATPAQLPIIRKYLTRYYGVVAVNTAAADEIADVGGFSAKDAQAIVAYRTEHGKFADLDALKKVPGIDLKKIEDQPEAFEFK